ncbi:LysR family transcriptional regulator [Lysinibacillus sp. FSL W8-0992]|uniref:LysR family transcriptional regulator n=1 Tax=Lysinibacillus sp. FSL W8-0992 TaxID=2954643 RepID=UPI0030F6CD0A
MEIKHLQTFLTAAKTLNFTQTAKILDYAQSSITAQIKSLEDELGTTLFERLGKRIYLTKAGIELTQYAEKIIQLDEEMRYAVTGDSELNAFFTIGAQESQCTYRLPRILKAFKLLHPQVELIFKPVHASEIAKNLLQTDHLDLAFITDTRKIMSTLYTETLLEEDLVLVVSPTHHLNHTEKLTLEEIAQETILLTEKGCSYRTQFENKLQQEGIFPRHVIEFVSIEAIKQCVIAELGISLLPKMVVEKELISGTLIELPIALNLNPIYTEIAWHKDKNIPPYLNDFIQIVRQEYKSFYKK